MPNCINVEIGRIIVNKDMTSSNVLITGVPRSGTTLTCYLLNKLPNTVALHEPIKFNALYGKSKEIQVTDILNSFLAESRETLLRDGTAVSKHVNGQVPDNPIGTYQRLGQYIPKSMRGRLHPGAIIRRMKPSLVRSILKNNLNLLRAPIHRKGIVQFSKPSDPNFLLCVKHNEPFTFTLDQQNQHFSCYAVIRNPLAVLASWNSVNFRLQNGNMPMVIDRVPFRIPPNFASITNRHDRQIFILDLMFQQYAKYLTAEQIIYYEEIVATKGKALQKITPMASQLDESLVNKNKNPLYDEKLFSTLGRKLLNSNGAYWQFYTKNQVADLMP